MALHRIIRLMIAFVWMGAFSLVAESTYAQPLKKDRIDTFQLKSITKKRRHELALQVSASLNDSFVQTMVLGGSYSFHITEGFAFELSGGYALTAQTQTVTDLRVGIDPSQPGKVIRPSLSRVQFHAFGHLVWTPLLGKFALGKAVFDFDIYLVGGAGYIRTNRDNLIGASFGIGWRVFLTKWCTLRMDLRDSIYSQKLLGVSVLTHNLFFNLGVGFLLPTEPVYTFEKEP